MISWNYWVLCTNLQGFLHTMNSRSTTIQKALIAHPMMMPSFTLNSGLSSNSDILGFCVGSTSDVLSFVAGKKVLSVTIFLTCHHWTLSNEHVACLEPILSFPTYSKNIKRCFGSWKKVKQLYLYTFVSKARSLRGHLYEINIQRWLTFHFF